MVESSSFLLNLQEREVCVSLLRGCVVQRGIEEKVIESQVSGNNGEGKKDGQK